MDVTEPATFKVVCTGRGHHGRISFGDITIHPDGSITEQAHRLRANAPKSGRWTTVPTPTRGILAVIGQTGPLARTSPAPHRTPNGLWRWRCPSCGLDRRLTDARLRDWISLAEPGGLLDISALPR